MPRRTLRFRVSRTTTGRGWAARIRAALAGTVVVMMLMLAGTAPAGADSLDELEARRVAAEKTKAKTDAQIEELEHDLEDTDKEMAQAYVRLKEIEGELPLAQAELDKADAELTKAQREADDLAERLVDSLADEANLVTKLEDETAAKDETRSTIAELARRAYRGENSPDGVSLIIGAQSAQDFVNQYSLSQTAIRTQSNSLDDLQQSEAISLNTQVRLEAVREAIAGLKDDADAALKVAKDVALEAAARRAEVAVLLEDQRVAANLIEGRRESQLAAKAVQEAAGQSLTDEIQEIIGLTNAEKARIKKVEQAAAKKAADELRAQQEAERVAAEQAREDAKEAAKNPAAKPKPKPTPAKPPVTTPPVTTPPDTGGTGSTGRGFLGYPTAVPYITSSYGWRLHPVLGYPRLHAGTDFRAYCGTSIVASAAGTVVGSRYLAGFGNQVLLNHGTVNGVNLMTSYNHLSKRVASVGEKIKKGQVVGRSGTTGTSTACHLHFEVYVNGSAVNPMSML